MTRGYTFGSTELVTNIKLHNLVDNANISGITGTDIGTIDFDALATLASAQILVGNANGTLVQRSVSGDVSMTTKGTITLATAASGQMFVANSNGTYDSVTPGGDVAVTNNGTFAVNDFTLTSEATDDAVYFNGTNWVRLPNGRIGALNFIVDGGGAVMATGIKGDVRVPFAASLMSAAVMGDQEGSVEIDIWKDTIANFPPTNADSITATRQLSISNATYSTDASLSGWTKAVAVDDVLRFNVDSVGTLERLTVELKYKRT